MLRQAELWRVLGRKLTARLIAAKWIEPVRENGGIFFDPYKLHRALGRLDKHARNGLRIETTKVRKPLEDLFADFSLENL
ncbi:MAG: hypothetical protein WAK31_31210 [Chthoniobacterales bacterium]